MGNSEKNKKPIPKMVVVDTNAVIEKANGVNQYVSLPQEQLLPPEAKILVKDIPPLGKTGALVAKQPPLVL